MRISSLGNAATVFFFTYKSLDHFSYYRTHSRNPPLLLYPNYFNMVTFHQPAFAWSTWTLPLIFLLSPTLRADPANRGVDRYQPRPYTVNVDPAFIEETRMKASKFRNSVDSSAPAWFDGPPASEIESVAKYWTENYNWSAVQDEINANFSHFYTTVPPPSDRYNESVDLHFIHQRSEEENAIPILFLHGWPSTSLEWQKIIPGLVKPENDSQPAFHVVAPDFPGYGFSPAPIGSRIGLERSEYATIFASLMKQLGYDRYILYSTDLGTIVAMSLIVDYKDHVLNHVSDFLLTFVSDADQTRFEANQTSPEETAYIRSSNAFFGPHSGYSAIQSTYPLSLAYSLNDSPVGFLAWYYQLAQTASDRQYSAHELVTDTLLLYIPGVYNNIRSYKELFMPTSFIPDEKFTVPTSVLQFGGYMHYPELANWTYVVSCIHPI
jgi:pimeloyl-ACP methyl ester carboxylesterase